MSCWPHRSLRALGILQIVFAGLGLWYNATGTISLVAGGSAAQGAPYFWQAYGAMSAICVACYVTLILVGVQLIRLRTQLVPLFVGIMIFEVVYFLALAPATVWVSPALGTSIAAATGVANGGLMFQFIVVFPLWASLLAGWAKGQIEAGPTVAWDVQFPTERVARPSDWAYAAVNCLVMFFVVSMAIGLGSGWLGNGTVPPGYVALGVPVLVSVSNALLAVRQRRRKRRRQIEQRRAARLSAGRCPLCEYNLTGLPKPRCPECGATFDARALIVSPAHRSPTGNRGP